METLISENIIFYSNPPFSQSLSRLNFRSTRTTTLKNRFFLQFSNHRWSLNSKKPNFCSISTSSASISTNYGGWDDLKLIEHSGHSGKLNRFQNFLVSVGIDDGKHIFMFILGLVSALAISRVRVSTIVVLPASVLVFAIGFSLGFARGGGVGFSIKEISRIASNKGDKEENSRVYAEKLRNSVEFFNELNDKIANLEKEMKGAMNSNFVQVGELESYHNILKNISLDIIREKNVIEASTNDTRTPGGEDESSRESVDNGEAEKGLNQKSSRRKRDLGTSFFEFFQFIGGLFQENSVASKPNKVKDIVKREVIEQLNSKMVNNQIHGSKIAGQIGEENVLDTVSKNSIGSTKIGTSPQEGFSNPALDQHGDEILGYGSGEMEEIPGMMKGKSVEEVRNIRKLLNDEEYYNQSNRTKFINNQRNFFKMANQNKNKMQASRDSFRDPSDVGFNMRPREVEEETFKRSNGAYMPNNRNNDESRTYSFDLRERREKPEDGLNLGKHQIGCDMEHDSASSSSSSSMISEDVVFDRHLTDATNLLKQARECLKGKNDEEKAEAILYKSARLLSKAISMKPMSLLAVGQLGNTFLLHGELKLKLSRELRTLLSTGDSLSREKVHRVELKGRDDLMRKDRIASALIDVCEECEELLVEAGRKYRMALSIDGNDVRALYNWGLALSYRAQLIVDIGPEAAFDADKVYLAAIDKFDAMMSKSNAYAPDALFRWGMALRQRSQLRPSNSKEKMKLLHQAKRLFEDALTMDSNNNQVREALSSCISEVDYWNF